jgi:hypothetical protein
MCESTEDHGAEKGEEMSWIRKIVVGDRDEVRDEE